MNENNKDHALDLLKGAYSLKTSDDNKIYYKNFAPHYDDVFVKSLGYVYPEEVAKILMSSFQIDGAICDIGCGTGLVAEKIKKINKKAIIDGVDISTDMIEISKTKKLYRNLFDLDLNGNLSDLSKNYAAIISAGTFTHGHLGSDVLRRLVEHFDTNTCCVIGINFKHYAEKGFEDLLKNLASEKAITDFSVSEAKVYYKEEELIENNNNKACICTFRII